MQLYLLVLTGMKGLDGKCIVIIGGTSGLGLSAARVFVQEGAKIVVVSNDAESVVRTAAQLGGHSLGYSGDATKEGTAEEAIKLCVKSFGAFNGLYHVAGGSGRKLGDGPLHELTWEGWNKTLELNLTSAMLSSRAAVKKFRESGKGGSLLLMASVLGYSPSPKYFDTHAYAASKAAIIGFTRSIAAYYAKDNIRVNAVAPSLMQTPMAQRAASDENILSFIKSKQPLDGGRMGVPSDLDGAAIYFMSDYSKFTTGQILAVDGGWEVTEGQY
jgi:NAD(P)-dependent dehydrogenase (short-subunit alcohol dehydrogenase family)